MERHDPCLPGARLMIWIIQYWQRDRWMPMLCVFLSRRLARLELKAYKTTYYRRKFRIRAFVGRG